MGLTKLGVSEIKSTEEGKLATGLPWLAAAVLNLKEGDRLVWYLGRGELRVRVVRAEEATPEGEDIVNFLG